MGVTGMAKAQPRGEGMRLGDFLYAFEIVAAVDEGERLAHLVGPFGHDADVASLPALTALTARRTK